MLSLGTWPSLPLNIPIFYGSDYVTFIKGTYHNLHFVVRLGLRVAHQEIYSSADWLAVFAPSYLQLAETQKRGVVSYPILQPLLVKPD